MKKVLILACGLLLFTTSCLFGEASPGFSSADYAGSIEVIDITSGEVTYTDKNATVSVWIPNIVEPKFDFIFNNMKFADGMPVKLDIKVAGVPFASSISEDEVSINYLFEAENIIPTAGDIAYEKYKIGKIWGCIGTSVNIEFTLPSENKRVVFTTTKSEDGTTTKK